MRKPWLWLVLLLVWTIVQAANPYGLMVQYLYASSLFALFLLCGLVYAGAFPSDRWSSPPEKEDDRPQAHWKDHLKAVLAIYATAAGSLLVYWAARALDLGQSFGQAAHNAAWFLFYLVVTLLSAGIVWWRFRYLHFRAAFVSLVVSVLLLFGYESAVLSWGYAWQYNGTIFGWVLGVPLENIIFVYPFTPLTAMICYSLWTRRQNDLKAFWFTLVVLTPPAIVVELVGIYVVDLWVIFNDHSILPMGRTNLEEFVYYILFTAFSMLCYVFFARNLKERV